MFSTTAENISILLNLLYILRYRGEHTAGFIIRRIKINIFSATVENILYV